MHVAPMLRTLFATEVQEMRTIFARLEYLHLQVRDPTLGNTNQTYIPFQRGLKRGKLVSMLAYAQNLRRLTLDLPGSLEGGWASSHSVTSNTIWPKLDFLSLEGITFTAKALSSLIDRHTRLKTLRLGEISLQKGCWRDLLAEWAGNQKSVEGVQLRGCFFDKQRTGRRGIVLMI